MTIDTYGHLKPGATADAVDKFNTGVIPIQATGTDSANPLPKSCHSFATNGVRNRACEVRDDAKESPTPTKPNAYAERGLGGKMPVSITRGRVAELADARDLKSRPIVETLEEIDVLSDLARHCLLYTSDAADE